MIAAQRRCEVFGLGHVRTLGSNYGSGCPRRGFESPPVYVFVFRTWSSVTTSEQGYPSHVDGREVDVQLCLITMLLKAAASKTSIAIPTNDIPERCFCAVYGIHVHVHRAIGKKVVSIITPRRRHYDLVMSWAD